MTYLNDWEDSGFIGMVGDFSDIFITKDEYEATVCPYPNKNVWIERKAQMDEELKKDQWQGINIILASYGNENYSGDAFVLFEKDGVLYEVNGGHCSCHGLEGQWEPEQTSIESLRHRLETGSLGADDYSGNQFADELREALIKLENKVI